MGAGGDRDSPPEEPVEPVESAQGGEEATGFALAAERWFTGLLFAWALSFVVVVGAVNGPIFKGVFHQIEETGVDASMRMRAVLRPTAPIGRESDFTSGEGPSGYVFINLDSKTCFAAHPDERCFSRSAASPAAAAAVALAVLKAKPRVIVIDAYLWDRSAPGEADTTVIALEREAKNNPQTRIITPAPALPLNDIGRVSVEWSPTPVALRNGDIKYALAVTWPDGVDGVMRRYPAIFDADVYPPAPDPSPKHVQVPPAFRETQALSLPYLAARYALREPGASDWRALDCLADQINPGSIVVCCVSKLRPEAPSEAQPRIFYTFPALPIGKPRGAKAGRSDQTAETRPAPVPSDAGQIYSRFKYTTVASADGQLLISPERLADKVVVIGVNSPQAMDQHMTPLGEMSGAELIVNAIRSFVADAELRESIPSTLWREFLIGFVASLPFLLFWLAQQSLMRFGEGSSIRKLAMIGATSALFLATIAVGAALSTYVVVGLISSQMDNGASIDALLPLAVLSLEGFAHGAKYIIDALEEGVAHGHRALSRHWRALLKPRR
jgi:hypothetical protein